MNWLKPAFAIAMRHFFLLYTSVARIPQLFVWVFIDILLWGFVARYLNTMGTGQDFISMFLGTILLWAFLVRVMHSIIVVFFEDVWTRNFLNIFASPLSLSQYVTGLVIAGTLTSFVGLAAMLILAVGVFGLSYLTYGLMLIPFMLVLYLCGVVLGVFGAAIVLRFGPPAEWLIWPIPAVFSPFAAVFYPIAVLPEWMQWVSKAIPPSYVFEAMRAILRGEAFPLTDLYISIGLTALYMLLASVLFVRVYKIALRTGLIARYSAEAV